MAFGPHRARLANHSERVREFRGCDGENFDGSREKDCVKDKLTKTHGARIHAGHRGNSPRPQLPQQEGIVDHHQRSTEQAHDSNVSHSSAGEHYQHSGGAMGSLPLAAGILAPWGFVLSPALGAILMSASTVVVAINAQLLRRVSL
jgi:hypothetical protein